MTVRLIQGNALDELRKLPSESVHCVVTSPPYLGLRSYRIEPVVWGGTEGCAHEWGVERIIKDTRAIAGSTLGGRQPSEQCDRLNGSSQGQWCQFCGAWRGHLGLEPSIDLFVSHLVSIFREVKRVLHPSGTCWVNLGDSYASGKGTCNNPGGGTSSLEGHAILKDSSAYPLDRGNKSDLEAQGLKPLDLCGIPERFALAMQQDGWFWRDRIAWIKNSPMPESIRGWFFERHRCTIEEYERLRGLPEAAKRGGKNRARRLQGVPSGTPKDTERSVQTDASVQRECQGLRPNASGKREEPSSQGALSPNGEVPTNRATAGGKAGGSGEEAAVFLILQGESQQQKIPADPEGQKYKESNWDSLPCPQVQRARESIGCRMDGNPTAAQASLLLLQEEGAYDDGSCYPPLEGRTTCAGERSTRLPQMQQRQTGQDRQALIDCPGCPICTPHSGYVLRKGSWRTTRAWEYIFMFAKTPDYFACQEQVREGIAASSIERARYGWHGQTDDGSNGARTGSSFRQMADGGDAMSKMVPDSGRNPRSWWLINSEPALWDFCLACGAWFGKGGWNRKSVKRWSETETEDGEPKTVHHAKCPNCQAVDQFVAHYALFPTDLPKRCILAATSDAGVCPKCGSQWAPVVEISRTFQSGSGKSGRKPSGDYTGDGQCAGDLENDIRAGPCVSARVLSYRATCQCPAHKPIPATVLDPFSGGASTGLAADRLGRSYIGIELSESYLKLSKAKLQADGPMMAGMEE